MDKLSTSEKWKLLGQLYKHGTHEEKLTEALPEIDAKKVTKAIRSYKQRAKRSLDSSKKKFDQTPIDMWYDFVNNCHRIEGTSHTSNRGNIKRRKVDPDSLNFGYLLEKSMLYAACFEEHYQGESPDEPNYNEIYKYLSQLLAGEEPTQMRPGNAKKILEIGGKIKELIDTKEYVQQYSNYITSHHSISYVKPGVNIDNIIEEKRNKEPEIDANEVSKLFNKKDKSSSGAALDALNPKDSQYVVKKQEITLKLSLKQRALASTISSIPGINPLEMVLPALVKPRITLQTKEILKNGFPVKKES
ncbi:UNVERIFIED_CONTAM: hypothetical protein RMT77_006102 [Armadillidium vulgare]